MKSPIATTGSSWRSAISLRWWASTDRGSSRWAATFAPILTAGGFQTVTINEPNVTVKVQRQTSSGTTNYQNADVKFTSSDCAANNSPAMFGPTTNSSGQSTYGIPYGAYTVCVDDNQNPPSASHYNTATFTNDTSTGKTVPAIGSIVIDARSSNTSKQGTCP